MAQREPVKYTVLERSLIGNRIYEEGEVAEYDGLPAENLAPLCDEGHARYQEYLKSNAERIAKMRAAHPEQGGAMDSQAFAAAIATEIAKLREGEDARVATIVKNILEAQKAETLA
jgi:hypothetical protein